MEAKDLEVIIEVKQQIILCLCDVIAEKMKELEELKIQLNDKKREG